MLTDEEKKEIEAEFPHYERKSALCIDALKVVQRRRGWVSDEAVRDVADFLEMSVDEVDGVATFYNLIYRKPVGKRVLLVCDSVSCWVMGYERVLEKLEAKLGIGLGKTTTDGNLTVLPVPCLGACDHAPVAMLDDELLLDINPDRADGLGLLDQSDWKDQVDWRARRRDGGS